MKITEIKSDYAIPAGDHKLDFKFDYDGNGVGKGACVHDSGYLYVSV